MPTCRKKPESNRNDVGMKILRFLTLVTSCALWAGCASAQIQLTPQAAPSAPPKASKPAAPKAPAKAPADAKKPPTAAKKPPAPAKPAEPAAEAPADPNADLVYGAYQRGQY